jgi:hydroxymethylglutaryl-CoA lyase
MRPSDRKLAIQEVSPRDGFQIEAAFIPTEKKIAYIDRLSQTGLAKIEVTSFSSPAASPQLRDAEQVLERIDRVAGVEYTALVPNVRGYVRSSASRLDEINVVMSASETHNRANLRMSREDSLQQFEEIARLALDRVKINASLSTAFGCPFEGRLDDAVVLELVGRIVATGISGLSLCDTTGMANPLQVESLCRSVRDRWPKLRVTAHFHNTRGMGLANVLAALEVEVERFDASLGGLGGCPYAPGATGNICTEDLVHMLIAIGYDTGVKLNLLLQIAAELPALVNHDVPGQVVKAGPWTRRYAAPAGSTGACAQASQGIFGVSGLC